MSVTHDVTYYRTSPDHPPVAVTVRQPVSLQAKLAFGAIALVAAAAWAFIATVRGEVVNGVYFVIAAVCTYTIAYRFYSKYIEYRIVRPRNDRATPGELYENGRDFQPTDRRVLFGHHFAAIAGAGPLVGPVLAVQMGYLPGFLWIVIGCVIGGAVQDYLVLWLSNRRRGRSLGQMVRDEMGTLGGIVGLIGVFVIMLIIIAVLGMIVVNALAESPWGVFSIAMTIPIALFMGLYLRFLRPGRVVEVSVIGVILLLVAVVSGRWVAESSIGSWFALDHTTVAWCLIGYGFLASVLPVWLLLAPRDYLSTFMKVGTIVLLAIGVIAVAPPVLAPALSMWGAGTATTPAPVFAGDLFPFLFITIACGALSGFHSLISSGTTPKLVEKETQMRPIGYGGMLTESFVAVMALVAAASLDPHLYFVINASPAVTQFDPTIAAAWVDTHGLTGAPLSAEAIQAAAAEVGEESIISRTGGAPTLAIGMAQILSFLGGAGLKAFWYHFAVMFEALFILTTVDAGTRVARFMLSDTLGNLGGAMKKFKDPSWTIGAWVCSLLVVAGWGSVLLMGVTDPLGGINTLFPLFGIANQLLAGIALTLVTVVVCKKGLVKWVWIPAIPLVWDLVVTMTASWQKVFSTQPAIGYWAQHNRYQAAKAAGTINADGVLEWNNATFGTMANVNAVIRNTFIQGTLSIVFAAAVLVVFAVGMVVCVRAVRAGGLPTTEEPAQPSPRFAPASLFATKQEKVLAKQWQAYDAEQGAVRAKTAPH
jgi:carbon starvation protein